MAKTLIAKRLRRLALGNPGDARSVGDKIYELRSDFSSGYRIYYTNEGEKVIILLLGGNKSTQQHDIDKAKEIAKRYKDEAL